MKSLIPIRPLFLLLLLPLLAAPARGESRWKCYPSLLESDACVMLGGNVYSLSGGALMSYAPGSEEVRVFSRATGLSGAVISSIVPLPQEQALLLLYDDGDMDILMPEKEKMVNMPQFKNANLQSHVISDLTALPGKVLLAHEEGITVVDTRRYEFAQTFHLPSKVLSATLLGDSYYACCADGIYQGKQTDNLRSASAWTKINGSQLLKVRTVGPQLWAMTANGLWQIDPATGVPTLMDRGMTWMNVEGNTLWAGGKGPVTGRGRARTITVSSDGKGELLQFSLDNSVKVLSQGAGGVVWAACGTLGLVPLKSDGETKPGLYPCGTGLQPNSPIHNNCDKMDIAPSGRLLVAGGSLNYTGVINPGTLYYYDKERFINFPDTLEKVTDLSIYNNVTSAAEDPRDATHVFASTARTGLYEFKGGQFVRHYDFMETPPAPLYSATSGRDYTRLTGLKFDKDGNLWMFNCETDTVIRILGRDGTWKSLYFKEIKKWPTFDTFLFGNNGDVWMSHRRIDRAKGADRAVAYLDYGGTLEDRTDDRLTIQNRFINQDGEEEEVLQVYDVCRDKEGIIWVCTDKGPFLIYSAEEFQSDDFRFTQVKVPRNDGSDYADYLLAGVPVTKMCVDKANRKWIATMGDGIYLLSADNLTQLEHFTTKNSPLLSDNILSLAVYEETGLVMIGTEKGLMSYQADRPVVDKDLSDKVLRIYPNPVRPGYEGDVTIAGVPENAEVKITTAAGQLVATGRALGGSWRWDGKDGKGDRASTGVYYVMVSTASGSKSATGKIVVVR